MQAALDVIHVLRNTVHRSTEKRYWAGEASTSLNTVSEGMPCKSKVPHQQHKTNNTGLVRRMYIRRHHARGFCP